MHNKNINFCLQYVGTSKRGFYVKNLLFIMRLHFGGTAKNLLLFCFLTQSEILCGKTSRSIDDSTGSSIMSIPKKEPATTITTYLYENSTVDATPETFTNKSTATVPSSTPIVAPPAGAINTAKPVLDECPDLSNISNLDKSTQEEFTQILTDSCRYDRYIKPPDKRVVVNFRFDMTHVESADHLQMKAHILVQMRYRDERLSYKAVSPAREIIMGEEALRNRIWVPHLILSNEKESTLMGLSAKDVFVRIFPDGEVVYAYRMSTLFFCWMNLKKFPFDYQVCDLTWVSWAYNATDMLLKWEEDTPFVIANNLHLTEFVLEDKWTEEGLSGNYSGITFKLKLRREVGYYIMDYFLPSILLVCTSWVTFWLQADAAPPRVTLGASTMLSFITLQGGLSKNLPKVSYIKASEIWFLACASFIFFSLAEFAFVNVIWRRKKKVEMKKNSSVHILKGALTPSLARRQVRKASSMNSLHKARSCSSLDKEIAERNTQANYLTVHSFPSSLIVPTITHSDDDLTQDNERVTTIPIPEASNNSNNNPLPHAFTTMTPQEVAIWIDNKSRIVFPLAFVVFNIFYWSFVYAL
ncbi:unnamed protein product [Phyllotreta striolata]|uniref:pH-sensitive chloride channel 2 n=1 Tax=Phyllotreta striolata TaxID=444603 RepID=A0A9N9TVI4_PHYSR|nr:unnamed protein product [Phyllotreta striolata]